MWRTAPILLCLLLTGAHEVSAQVMHRPPRLIELFDFEGTDDQGVKLGLGHQLPRHFYAIGRDPLVRERYFYQLPLHEELIRKPGYPHYSEVHFDRAHVISGDFSLLLTADGGNTGAFLEVGALAAVPGSNYRVTAKVRTAELRGGAAYLRAYFIDANGRRIEPSVRESDPIRAAGQWVDASVTLVGDFAQAAWIGFEVELQQPGPRPDSVLGNQQIIFSDITGRVWVDDIAVWQLPHVQAGTESPINVHRGTEPPQFELTMRDLTGRRLTATAVVYDHARREVDATQRSVGAGAPMQWHWSPTLPGYGWYLCDMTITDDALGATVARTFGAVLWLPNEGAINSADAQRFTLVAEDLPAGQIELVAPLLDVTQLRSVVLSVWDRGDKLARIDDRVDTLDHLLNRIISAERRVAFSLHPVPTELAIADGVSTTQPLGVLRSDPDHWLPYLRPILHRHGQRVRRWQLGEAKRGEAFFYQDPGTLLADVQAIFEDLVPGPQLVVPWRLDQSRRPELSSSVTFALDAEPGVSAEALATYLAEWGKPPSSVALYLREGAADKLDADSRAAAFALKMIEGWSSGVDSLAITKPWTEAAERRNAVLPDPLLGVFVNTAHRLSGRRVVARNVPIGEGLRMMVLDGPPGGMLIAWSESASPEDSVLSMVLGDDPVAIDLWGNRKGVPMRNGKHELRLTQTPVFIEGINQHLALMRAGFRVNEPFIESRQEPHRRSLILTNPFPITISGRLRVTGPEDWEIGPISHPFSLAPGQSTEFPVVMKFPLAEVAGTKELTANVVFDAGEQYDVDLAAPMELGLSAAEFKAAVTYEQGPDGRLDALLTMVVSNTSDVPQTFYVFAVLPGEPREERLIPELGPGQSMIKRMRFNGIDPDGLIRCGIRESNGPAMLNVLLNEHSK